MSLWKAAQQARVALANARDYIYLLETGDVSWSEEDQLQEIRAAIMSLKKALAEPEQFPPGFEFQPVFVPRKPVELTDEELLTIYTNHINDEKWGYERALIAEYEAKQGEQT